MNYLKLMGIALSLLLCSTYISAQKKVPVNQPGTNKSSLFTNLPISFSIDTKALSALLSDNTTVGKEVRLPVLNRESPFVGKVVSATSKYENSVKSIVIRLSSFTGAVLTLSSSTNPDGTVSFAGRIVSFQHGDAYELEKKGDQYVLNKKTFNDLVVE